MVEPRKLPVVAIVLASASLVVAIVAIGLMASRGDPAPAKEQKAERDDVKDGDGDDDDGAKKSPKVVSVSVEAAQVVELAALAVPVDAARDTTDGFRLDDAQLRKALRIESQDVLASFNGRPLDRSHSLREAMMDAGLSRAQTVYLEVKRGKQDVLLRFQVTGDLRRAYFDNDAAMRRPTLPTPIPAIPAPDPIDPVPAPDPTMLSDVDQMIAKIVKVDDTHVRVPEAVVDHLMANPMAYAKGARIIPSIKDGKPNGFKIYAVRPNSFYAKLNLQNGDTIKSVNGYELTSADKALEVYTKLRDAKSLSFEIDRRGRPDRLEIAIVK